MRGRWWAGCVAVTLLGVVGCEEQGPATIDREVFVETYVALRVAQLRGSGGDPLPAEERARVLAERAVTEEELLAFVEAHGRDPQFMERLWQDVEARLEQIRNAPGAGGDPGDPGDPSIPPP